MFDGGVCDICSICGVDNFVSTFTTLHTLIVKLMIMILFGFYGGGGNEMILEVMSDDWHLCGGAGNCFFCCSCD